jgi:hypothetical protein
MEPAATTIVQQLDGVKVTIDGVPAMRCLSCGETSLSGKVMIPIDEAIEEILVAAGAMTPPTPEEEAALREENRALARALGQEDAAQDDPAHAPASAPAAGARTTA